MWAPDTIGFWIIFGIVLGFTAVFFVIIISKAGLDQSRVPEDIETLFLQYRFFKSPECFVYDEGGILMSGIIDPEKFTNYRLNACHTNNQNTFTAFKLTLNYGTTSKTIKTSNWNDNRPFESRSYANSLRVFSENKIQNGEVQIEIQNKR